jgi:uncharacterized protein with ParB-like and HNH nuclease domain
MSFSINANTYTLKNKSRVNDKTILGNDVKYTIPIYQRPYSWTEHQIKKFISDIFISFWGTIRIVPQNQCLLVQCNFLD